MSRGLQVLVSLEALVVYVVVGLVFVVIANVSPAQGRPPTIVDRFLERHERIRRAAPMAVAVVFLIGLFLRPLILGVAAIAVTLMVGIVARFGEERWQLELDRGAGAETGAETTGRLARFAQRMGRTHASKGVIAAAAIAGLVVVVVTQAVTNPHPLPVATVETRGGETPAGPLIAVDEGDWYIGDCSIDPNGYIAIPAEEISNTSVVPAPAPLPIQEQSILNLFGEGINQTGCLDSVPSA